METRSKSEHEGESSEQTNVDYFQKLPDELVFEVFRGLTKKQILRCSAVCYRWRRICCDTRLGLWNFVRIRHDTVSLTTLAEVIKRGVRRMTLFGVTILDPDGNENPFPINYESKLEIVCINRPKISVLSLALILEHTTHLTKLDISRCVLNQRICNAIGRNSELRVLLLNGCSGLNGSEISAVLKGCQRLEELALCHTMLSTETIEEMIPHLSPSIFRLDIRQLGPDTLFSRHLSLIARTCPLANIDIAGNDGLMQAVFRRKTS